jgi:SAM-dependent methyltransferase
MSKVRNEISSYIKVVEGYRSIWKSALHDKPSRSDDATIRAARNYRNFSGIENLINSFLKESSFKHHLGLSLGCGVAKDLAKIKGICSSSVLFGVDTSPDALSEARRTMPTADINLICASISHLPFKKGIKFDMLVAGQSLDLEFDKTYLRRLLTEVTRYSSPRSRFYMTFYGTDETDLELYKCTPIGNLLDELGWNILCGKEYIARESPFARGVFWVAKRLAI